MSRSFKHSGWIQDQSSKKFGKRFANKRVRRFIDVISGNRYKRIYDSYNISDYKLNCRGVRVTTELRPGRFILKVRLGGVLSPWLFLDEEYKDSLWKEWTK